MSKLTKWFPPEVKPVHVGVYQTDFEPLGKDIEYSHWNGVRWGPQWDCIERAACANGTQGIQNKHWRGLSENPSAPKEAAK